MRAILARMPLVLHKLAVPVHLLRPCHWLIWGTSGATQSPKLKGPGMAQMYFLLPVLNSPAQNLQAPTYFFMVGYMLRSTSSSPVAWYMAQGTSTQASPHQAMAISGIVAGKP